MISYLGPQGTFTEVAANRFGELLKLTTQPKDSIDQVIRSVSSTQVEKGVVPFFNRLDGLIVESLVGIYNHRLSINGLEKVEVHFGIGGYDASSVHSHPKGLAQCTNYLNLKFPGITQIKEDSTAKAAEIVKRTGKGLAICSISALESMRIPIIAKNIENQETYTTFFLIGNEDVTLTEKNNQTMIALTPHLDRVGLLRQIFEVIESNGINCSMIHSHPTTLPVETTGIAPQTFFMELMTGRKRFENCGEELRKKFGSGKFDPLKIIGTY